MKKQIILNSLLIGSRDAFGNNTASKQGSQFIWMTEGSRFWLGNEKNNCALGCTEKARGIYSLEKFAEIIM